MIKIKLNKKGLELLRFKFLNLLLLIIAFLVLAFLIYPKIKDSIVGVADYIFGWVG